MKRPYTYDFPADGGALPGGDALVGMSYILYACQWVVGIRDWNYVGVLSPYWRLLHATRGRCGVRFGARRYALDRRTLLLIPPDVETDLAADAPVDMLYAHFLPVLPVAFSSVAGWSAPFALEATEAHRGIVRHLAGPGRDGCATDVLRFRALLDLCFAQLLEPLAAPAARVLDARVQRMLAWLREHFAEACPNAAVGQSVGLGRDQAVRLCKATTGRTPQAHLREVRLTEATRRLSQGRQSIKQVADACGFANRFHFTRAFAVRFGIGPAAFRKRMARNPPMPTGPSADLPFARQRP